MARKYYKKRTYSRNQRVRLDSKTSKILIYILFWPICLVVWLIKLLVAAFKSEKKNKKPNKDFAGGFIEQKKPQNFKTQTTQSISAPCLQTSQPSYTSKDSIMTNCEKEYFNAIRNIIGNRYIIQPQINLASIVSKEQQARYQNELFRNIDFGIFDDNYKLKVLIEINDKTHEMSTRIERDKKVRQICEMAGIPLITFWTKYGINMEYIEKRLKEYLIF